MNSWIYFVLVSELMWSLTSLFDKIIFSKGYVKNAVVFVAFNGLMNVLLVFLLPFFSLEPLSAANFFIVFLTGLFLTAGVVLYYKAVQCEEISRVLMLWQLVPIFVLVMSFLFLGDVLTKGHFIGFLLLIIAGLAISYKKTNGSFKLSRAFYYMLGSALLIALYYILSKHVYKITGFWSAFMWVRLAALNGALVLLLPSIRAGFFETVREMPKSAKALIGFKMLIDFSAFILLGLAMLDGPVSLISALGSALAPIFIFLMTLATSVYLPGILREDIDKKSLLAKLLAILLIIAGIIFINT